ncbi:M1 family metallopeptidase [Micrococcus lacusdianchii]|uniref:M1 family metallopeptidase n=1 Tax=Micrococcus lacusdianchii TaxID=2915940 RepID=UPI00200319C1|nr:M1 family metallopeptidase [Micrococcus sp. JXJ CY 30]
MSTDPYLPGVGTAAATVEHLRVELDVRLAANRVAGTAVLHLRLLCQTAEVELDLHRLAVDEARAAVGGRTLRVRATRPRSRPHRVVVALGESLPAGTAVELTLRYSGHPVPRRSPWGTIGWEELTDGVLVAGQPHGASTWVPCIDSPAVRQTADITLTTDAGYLPLANGRGERVRARGSRETWRWVLDRPVPAYLLTVQIGRYRQVTAPGSSAAPGVPPLRLVVSPRHQARAEQAMSAQARMMQTFVAAYGPYPFADYAAVVADDVLEIPLEAAGLSLFGTNHLDGSWESERLIAHEMAHQWFGNAVTLGRWSDLWLHEGFACYSEWLWAEATGRSSVTSMARRAWRGLQAQPEDLVLADPGPERMFDDRVYKRGALTVVALRRLLGDAAFGEAVRDWVARHAFATVDSTGLRAHLHGWAPRAGVTVGDVDAVLDAWTLRPELPAFPG